MVGLKVLGPSSFARFGVVVESLELARFEAGEEGVEESEGDTVGDNEGEDFLSDCSQATQRDRK